MADCSPDLSEAAHGGYGEGLWSPKGVLESSPRRHPLAGGVCSSVGFFVMLSDFKLFQIPNLAIRVQHQHSSINRVLQDLIDECWTRTFDY